MTPEPKLNKSGSATISADLIVAIAIAGSSITRSVGQRHLGIIFRAEGAEPQLLHLAWMNDLRSEPLPHEYSWLECVCLDSTVAAQFADWLQAVFLRNMSNGIPYGFDIFRGDDLTPNGAYIGVSGTGLTCATFVATCFASFGIPLVDVDSWPVRPDDVERQRELVDRLRRHQVPETHISAQERLIGKVARFRPEEIAAAAHFADGQACCYRDVQPMGVAIVKEMAAAGLL